MQPLFAISLWTVFYTYIGYGLIMWILSKFKSSATSSQSLDTEKMPTVAILIPAYNEEDIIEDKILNTLSLQYPQAKKSIYVVTDGSTDKTTALAREFDNVTVLHQDGRAGKIAAVNRSMKIIDAEITISTDANTTLNGDAILKMVRHFQDPQVVAVSGEKKVVSQDADDAAGSGEGMYWRYESFLKRLDAQVNTLVGAAGELIAYRSSSHEPVPENTVIEDFYMTMRFCARGYKVAYEPEAFAEEAPSASVKEELKRKVRICAGGFQAMYRLSYLLNPFRYGLLTFQYISHRVLRWTLAPLALVTLFFSSCMLASTSQFYWVFAALQTLFYLLAGLGHQFKQRELTVRMLHIPYYFCVMNYAVFAGFLRFIKGSQAVTWEKALRRA